MRREGSNQIVSNSVSGEIETGGYQGKQEREHVYMIQKRALGSEERKQETGIAGLRAGCGVRAKDCIQTRSKRGRRFATRRLDELVITMVEISLETDDLVRIAQ